MLDGNLVHKVKTLPVEEMFKVLFVQAWTNCRYYCPAQFLIEQLTLYSVSQSHEQKNSKRARSAREGSSMCTYTVYHG